MATGDDALAGMTATTATTMTMYRDNNNVSVYGHHHRGRRGGTHAAHNLGQQIAGWEMRATTCRPCGGECIRRADTNVCTAREGVEENARVLYRQQPSFCPYTAVL